MSCVFDLLVSPAKPGEMLHRRATGGSMGIAIWHCSDNDFIQRKMLRAATLNSAQLVKGQRDDIVWALDKIEEKLRHDRNNAAHAPLAFHVDIATQKYKPVPDTRLGSPRARQLQGKDLLNEFRLYYKLAMLLSGYFANIYDAIRNPSDETWPDRPPLPHAHQTRSRKAQRSRSTAK